MNKTSLSQTITAALRPVTLDSYQIFSNILKQQARFSCECSFANLFLWSSVYKNQWMYWKDRIFVYSPVEQILYFPHGNYVPPKELYEMAAIFREEGHFVTGYYDVPDDYLLHFPELSEYFAISSSANQNDYLYNMNHLATMSGAKLRKKRNLVHQFENSYPNAKAERITPANLPVVKNLAEQLNAEHIPSEFIHEENQALENLWQNCFAPELHLDGLIIFADDIAAGFSILSPLTGCSCCDIHFEKAIHSIKGAPQYLTWKVADEFKIQYQVMNREQDLGEEGLRQAKRSLDPFLQLRRNNLTFIA